MITLPDFSGPFSVGYIDLENKGLEIDPLKVSPLMIQPEHGVVVRLFYPSNIPKGTGKTSKWLPENWKWAKGHGDFLKLPTIASALGFFPFMSLLYSRASNGVNIVSEKPTLPVVIFSHGLAGFRSTYSQICGNLASHGMIVAAIEHADGTACFSQRLSQKDGNIIEIPYRHPNESDRNEGEDETQALLRFRTRQLKVRRNEVEETLELLTEINQGKLEGLISPPENINSFKGRLDLGNLVMAGHSFGAATAIHTIYSTQIDFKCAMIFDPWMFTVEGNTIQIPTLNLQSLDFHWEKNLKPLEKMVRHPIYNVESQFGVIKDTRHQDFSDLGLFAPYLMTVIKQCGPLDPVIMHKALNQVCLDFITKHVTVEPLESEFDLSNNMVFGDDAFKVLYKHKKSYNPYCLSKLSA